MAEGIRKRHSKGCPAKTGRRCCCNAGYEASVFSPRDGKKLRKTFRREAEARSWRAEAKRSIDSGALRASKPTTIREAWQVWIAGAEVGAIRNRSGDRFKPSALRAYRGAMENRVLPAFGRVRLGELRRPDLQRFADDLVAEGLSSSYVHTTLLPLRAICRP